MKCLWRVVLALAVLPSARADEAGRLAPREGAVDDALGGGGRADECAAGLSASATGPDGLAEFERALGLRDYT